MGEKCRSDNESRLVDEGASRGDRSKPFQAAKAAAKKIYESADTAIPQPDQSVNALNKSATPRPKQ